MTKPLYGAKFDGFHQQIMHLPVGAQLMMAGVLNEHNNVSKSHISHNLIIVFLLFTEAFRARITQFYIIKVLSFIRQNGQSRYIIMGETGYGL